jgi:Na+-driven multidrug efflux pump
LNGVGLALGFLIGVITGIVFLLILKTADRLSEKGTASILTLTTELLAIPTFWFGGPWLATTGMLKGVGEQTGLLNSYLISLVAVFAIISLYPAARWIIQLGDQLGAKRQ